MHPNKFQLSPLTISISSFLCGFALALTLFTNSAAAKKPHFNGEQPPEFDRNQMMLINLNRGTDCPGFAMLSSLKAAKEMTKNLDKGLRQLEKTDQNFAKSRGRADDLYFAQTTAKMKHALGDAETLSTELEDAYDSLKDTVRETLVMDQKSKEQMERNRR